MISLCFEGTLFILVGIAIISFGTANIFYQRFISKKKNFSIRLFKASKIFYLSAAYYLGSIIVYLTLSYFSKKSGEYISCSDKEGLELFIMMIAIIMIFFMRLVVNKSDSIDHKKYKLYVYVANFLSFCCLLVWSVILFSIGTDW